jgi:hypothetical protein
LIFAIINNFAELINEATDSRSSLDLNQGFCSAIADFLGSLMECNTPFDYLQDNQILWVTLTHIAPQTI